MSGMSLIQQRAALANADTVNNAVNKPPQNNNNNQQNIRNRNRNNNQRSHQSYTSTAPPTQYVNNSNKQRHNSVDTNDTCLLCAYSLKERQYIGVYNCTHSGQICGDCLIRTKLLMPNVKEKPLNNNSNSTGADAVTAADGTGNNTIATADTGNSTDWVWRCQYCRTIWSTVIITESYEHRLLPIESFNKSQLVMDTYTCVQYESQVVAAYFHKLYSIYCTICDSNNINRIFTTDKQYQQHLSHTHKLYLCTACVTTRRVYITEQQTYSKSQLLTHFKLGATFERHMTGPIEPHPFCQFCGLVPFYSNDELYAHLTQYHRTCRFCQADQKQIYMRDDNALIKHYTRYHYICDHPDCMQKIGRISPDSIAFRDPLTLRTHTINFHTDKSNMSKAELKSLQTMNVISFQQSQSRTNDNSNRYRSRRISNDDDTFEWTSIQNNPHNNDIDDFALSDNDEESYPSLSNVQQAQRDTVAAQQQLNNEATNNTSIVYSTSSSHGFASVAGKRVQPRNDIDFPVLPSNNKSSTSYNNNQSFPAQPSTQQHKTTAQSLFGFQQSISNNNAPKSNTTNNSFIVSNDTNAFPSLTPLNSTQSTQPSLPVKKPSKPTLVTSFRATLDHTNKQLSDERIDKQAIIDQRKLEHVPLPLPDPCSSELIQQRSSELINTIKTILNSDDKFNEFRRTSNMYRQGSINATQYYAYYCELMNSHQQSESLLMIIISLLPDGDKREQLHVEYARNKVWQKLQSKSKPTQNQKQPTFADKTKSINKISLVKSTVNHNNNNDSSPHTRQFDNDMNNHLVPLQRDVIPPEPIHTTKQQHNTAAAQSVNNSSTPVNSSPIDNNQSNTQLLKQQKPNNRSNKSYADINIPNELPDPAELDLYTTIVSELQLPGTHKTNLQLLLFLENECINTIVHRHNTLLQTNIKRFMFSHDTRKLLYKYCSTIKYQQIVDWKQLNRFGVQPNTTNQLNNITSMYQRYGTDMVDSNTLLNIMIGMTSNELILLYEYIIVVLRYITDIQHNTELQQLQLQSDQRSNHTINNDPQIIFRPLDKNKKKSTSIFDRQ